MTIFNSKKLPMIIASLMAATSAQAADGVFDNLTVNEKLIIATGTSTNPSQVALEVQGATIDDIPVADPLTAPYQNDSVTRYNAGYISSQGGYSHFTEAHETAGTGSQLDSRFLIADAETGLYNVAANGSILSETYVTAEDGITVIKSTTNNFNTTFDPNVNTRLSSSNLSSDSLTIADADTSTTYGVSGFTVENSDVAVTFGVDENGNAFVTRTTPNDTVGTTDNLVRESDFTRSIADLVVIAGATEANLALTNKAVDTQKQKLDGFSRRVKFLENNMPQVTSQVLIPTVTVEKNENTSKQVQAINEKVVALDSRITKTVAATENLSAQVNTNTGKIQTLDKKMRQAMAQQSALSGLFQPYGVGKFSATASLGGHGGETAVAVGTGYRFNENLATKGGVAFNSDDSSYNVSINYEF